MIFLAWLFEMLTNSGVESTPASWCVCAVVVLCVYSLFKLILWLFGGDRK